MSEPICCVEAHLSKEQLLRYELVRLWANTNSRGDDGKLCPEWEFEKFLDKAYEFILEGKK
jgi:hypothetical protein